MSYPQWREGCDPVNHLLFDIGYSYALLHQCKKALKDLAEIDQESADLIHAIEGFETGRLQYRHEIYDNAQAAFDKMFRP